MPVYEDLRRTESAHFIYIYQVSLASQVPALISICEEACDLLTPALRWTPRGNDKPMTKTVYQKHRHTFSE